MKGAKAGHGKGSTSHHSPTKRAVNTAIVRRVLIRARRVINGDRAFPGVKLVSALLEHGPRYAHHLQREHLAWRRGRRADALQHLLARLNLAGSQPGTRVNALLKGLEQRDIASFDYASLERDDQRVAELLGRLRLAEVADLVTYFRYFGDFRTASRLRIQLLEAHLRAQERVNHVRLTSLAAALELGRPEAILQIVATKRTYGEDRSHVDDAAAMAHALSGDMASAERLWERSFSAQDRAFGAALRGRTVAIVGPAQPSADLATEIDSFDLVVRTNFFSTVDARAGSRTDISYYNNLRLGTRGAEIRNVAPSLSWLIPIRSSVAKVREVVPEHPGVRAGHNGRKLFVEGHPLAMPCILNDVLRFRPGRVKLFGTDFYTAPCAYDKAYHTHVGSDSLSFSLRNHEPFSSFKFVQHVRNAGLIEADGVADQVLNMSTEQYAARLQQLYGHYSMGNQRPQAKPVA
jgi:hypothetical protein